MVRVVCNDLMILAHKMLQNTEAEAIVGVLEWAKQWEE